MRDFNKALVDLNTIQRAALPGTFQRLAADFDAVAFDLDQRVFNAFDRLDILSPAARQLSQEVDVARKKRRAEVAVPPGSGASTPVQIRAGACRCRTAPLCQQRCPCVKAGQRCTSLCVCGVNCYGELLVM